MKRLHLHSSATVVLALIVSLVSACGGGDDAPSREEFARNADGVCADIERDINSLDRINPNSLGELEALVGQLKSKVNDGVERLSELERPSGDAGDTADEFISTLQRELREQAIPALDELVAAAKERDRVKLRAAVRKLDALDETRSDQLARELGANGCTE